MIVHKYGLTFRRLQRGDIELIRQMRNSDVISSRMHDQKHITAEQQVRWFDRVNTANNYFFIILSSGTPVGLVQAKDVDYDVGVGEGGVYIWDAAARISGVGAKASLCLLDIAFTVVKLNAITAKVRSDNPAAHRHNLSFGYRYFDGESGERMILRPEDFLLRAPQLRKICSNGRDLLPTSIENMEFPEQDTVIELYSSLPSGIRAVFAQKIAALK